MKITELAKKIWRLIYPMLIYLAIQVLVINVIEIAYVIYWHMNGISSSIEIKNMLTETFRDKALLLTMVSALVTIPIVSIFIKKDIEQKKETHTLKRYEPVNKLLYFLIIPFGIFSMEWASMFVSILKNFMPKFMIESYTGAQTAIYESSIILQLLAGGIVAPIVEEMIFRGLVYQRMKEYSNIKIAAIVSAVAFGVFHGNWIQAPYAIIIGLMAVFVYEKYKSMIAPIVLHMSANLASVVLTYGAAKINQSQTSNVQQFSNWYMIKTISSTMLVFIILAWAMGSIINMTVKPKEVENEIINSSDSML